MKRWMVLFIIFALMGSAIAMMSCTWEEFDEFMGGHYGCGCFWDCTKDCFGSLSGSGEDYVDVNTNAPCAGCLETFLNCSCNVLDGLLCGDE